MTKENLPTKANINATQSMTDVRRINGDGRTRVNGNGHEALDLAETAEASSKLTADRLELKRVEHERNRYTQRVKFDEQMRLLEAEHLAEERQLLINEAASAPSTPIGRNMLGSTASVPDMQRVEREHPAPIGQGRETANGIKSMPGSRRPSGHGQTFGFEKLSVMNPGMKERSKGEEEVDAEGAQNSVKYLVMGDDEPLPLLPKDKRLSAASAALDLAPLSQTPPRNFRQRPFETSLKTSEWPQFANQGLPRGVAAFGQSQQPIDDIHENFLGSRKASPVGMADSIASLPAIPSKSVPGTPFGFAGGMNGARRSGMSPNIAEGLTQAQRGFSNPDLARAFGQVGGGFSMNEPNRAYNADPIYNSMFGPVTAPLPASAAVAAAFTPQGSAFDPYDLEDDGYGSGALYHDGPMGLKNKRAETDREFNRFDGAKMEDLQGELLSLCKDQHGCRYLQRKLEEGDPAHRDMIFRETYGRYSELMIDPFGNYLCQKLLEYSTDDQRSAIIDSVAADLVGISLNMHGTRAVQKMVEFLAQPRQPKQIRSLIYALSVNVVALIKDLNGNHVIQKCLNRLVPEDNQFIFNAVAANLIEVATHRHGCCVLQRSIDHASPAQRVQLVTEIVFNSLYLVQDPFGNYVIQYILDLNDARFSEPLIRTFIGHVCSLSVQKFSSNVVEKCIRVADNEVRKVLVGEVLNRSRLEKLLRDSYGNYVIQTVLDYCEVGQRMVLIECIRPILPSIRNTPYGKRIQSKLAREDASFSTYGPAVGGVPVGPGGRGGFRGAGGMGAGGGGFHRHLGRPQLQHINALTEVYGSQTGYVPQGPTGYGMQAPVPSTMAPTHTGLSYHAPGPDGQPWLHLRGGPGGGPASNWSVPLDGQDGSGSNEAPSQDGQLPDPSTMWPNPQQFMPFLNDRSGTHNPSQRHVAMM